MVLLCCKFCFSGTRASNTVLIDRFYKQKKIRNYIIASSFVYKLVKILNEANKVS